MKVYISPKFRGEDKGDGGIRRVVEAQCKWLPSYGVEITEHSDRADVIALHAGMWVDSDKPTVAHCHGLYWSDYKWLKWALAINNDVIRTVRQSDACTAPSYWVAHALKRLLWVNPVVAYHGIDPDDWPEITSHDDYVLWNKARVDPICDPGPVNVLSQQAPRHRFITTFGEASSNIQITGPLPYLEAKKLVQQAAVYLATTRETFGIGTLEAMASGVPVLGWRFGGQAEFVLHKKHGYLAKYGDYDDLVAGLEYCYENRERLGQAARDYVLKRFTWQTRMETYAKLYSSLLRPRDAPKVSVVITNYNLGKYLPDAVRSVPISPEIETIVVDDASTEPLPVLPDHVKVIVNSSNQYLAEALNTGITAARGEYIVPLDADNMLLPNAINLLSSALDKDRSLDIAYGRMDVVEATGRRFTSTWPPERANLDEQLKHRNQISSTAMYRKRVWERIGGYRRRCHTAEDADFWTRALSIGFTGRRVTDASTFLYLDRGDSMSHAQKDWAWHAWYKWAGDPNTRAVSTGGKVLPIYENPAVSVVIPVGPGHERLVLDALDSLQNQSETSWEAIVINDTDSDLPWVYPWTRVLFNKRHGASTARNIGIQAAHGEYVLFLDADDYLYRDALAYMLEAMRQGACFTYSDWYLAETGEYKEAPDFDPNDVLRQLPYPVTCMYRRDDLLKHSIMFDEQFNHKGWEDWDFQLQVVAQAGLCGSRIAAPLFHYRMSTGNLREAAYLKREDMKYEIHAKWGDYIDGKVANMAVGCGGCGKARTFRTGVPVPPVTQAGPEAQTVMLEYTGEEEGLRWFVGRMSGLRYRFGTDAAHRTRAVDTRDAEHLLSLGYFKVQPSATSTNFEPLQAAGPPPK